MRENCNRRVENIAFILTIQNKLRQAARQEEFPLIVLLTKIRAVLVVMINRPIAVRRNERVWRGLYLHAALRAVASGDDIIPIKPPVG